MHGNHETNRGPAADPRQPTRRANAMRAAFLGAAALLLAAQVAIAADFPPDVPTLRPAESRDAGLLPASVTAEQEDSGQWRCVFTYLPGRPVDRVALAGTFNGWNQSANLMTDAGDGAYTATVSLPAGRHEYKFVVNGSDWTPDPRNVFSAPDGHGGENSLLKLGRLANLTQSPAELGDGAVDVTGVEHDPMRPIYFQPLGEDRALVRVRTLSHDVHAVKAVWEGGSTELYPSLDDGLFSLWEGELPISKDARSSRTPGLIRAAYTFTFADGAATFRHPEVFYKSYMSHNIFTTPDWAKNAVWYQIMVERFRDGDPANNPEHANRWTSDWFAPSPEEKASGQTFYKWYVFRRFYGGDIQGLEEKLPYLKSLGVNAIYLNPIFKADTHHKYNASSYIHIDDHYGVKGDYEAAAASENLNDPKTWTWTPSDKLFLKFLKKAKSMGFRVILDGVFNHVGVNHAAFQDVMKNGKESRYADWFEITSWEPFEYAGWAGHSELPVFKKTRDGLESDQVKQHIFNVTRRWMDPDGDGDPSDGIDGWRLDVPNEIAMPFWEEWRTLVKSINPDAYITGEIWDRADAWLDGRHFDAVMNYEFSRAACDWIFNHRDKIKPSDIDTRLRTLRLAYPAAATYVLQNLMGSHDTDRVASMAQNPDRPYDRGNRVQDDNPDYDNSKPSREAYQRAALAALLQMTYVGAPMIYYGDEVGMWGADDPTCRKPMLWKDLEPYDHPEDNHVMEDLLAFYKQIIALRNTHSALRTGRFLTLLTDDTQDVWVFERADDAETLIVALNASGQDRDVRVPLPPGSPAKWSYVHGAAGDVATADGALEVRVPAIGGVVLKAR